MVTADIADLPVAERLKLMEALWDSLCAADSGAGSGAGSAVAPPAWHGAVLDERMRLIDSGADAISPWQEAKERIRNQTRAG